MSNAQRPSSLAVETRHRLIAEAQRVRQNAYAPYSNYRVGAALLAADGAIFTGCNIENAAFSPTICAERTALAKAVSEGVRTFQAVAVVTADGGSPCGVCRQVMFEFSPEMHVIIANAEGTVTLECSLTDLLPHGFRLSQATGS